MSIALNYNCLCKNIIDDDNFRIWASNVDIGLSCYLKEFEIVEINQIMDSAFGILLEGKSNVGRIVCKLIPPQTGRYHNEKLSYQLLSKKFMCPVIRFDDTINMILMKHCGKRIEGELIDKKCLNNFFLTVKDNFLPLSSLHQYSSFSSYYSILVSKLHNPLNNTNDHIEHHIIQAVNMYNEYFSSTPLFLIHGDLHYGNILLLDDCIRAVDPIGYIAPEAFEYVRFIGSELDKNLNYSSTYPMSEILSRWLNFFNPYCYNILEALYIDLVFRMHNTIIETSSIYSIDRWLYIISYLERFL